MERMHKVEILSAMARLSRPALTLSCLLGSLLVATPALAAWPGGNGAIAYSRYSPGGKNVWIEWPSGQQRQLTSSAHAEETEPTFSPDGRSIAYVRSYGRPGIWVMNSDGTDKREIVRGAGLDSPAFFPSGRRLLFEYGARVFSTRIGGPKLILKRRSDVEKLTPLAVEAESPVISPNGRWLAYSSRRQGDKQTIVLQDLRTGDRQKLRSGASLGLDFSPDGRRIVFTSRRLCGPKARPRRAISTIGLRDQRVDKVVNSCAVSWAPSDPVWSPSGDRILFARTRIGPVFARVGLGLVGANGVFLSGAPPYLAPHEYVTPSWQPLPAAASGRLAGP